METWHNGIITIEAAPQEDRTKENIRAVFYPSPLPLQPVRNKYATLVDTLIKTFHPFTRGQFSHSPITFSAQRKRKLSHPGSSSRFERTGFHKNVYTPVRN